MNIKENISLKKYTTFDIGGPARYFVEVSDRDAIIEAVKYSRKYNLKLFILGGGSNILISDDGFDGLVVRVKNSSYKVVNTQVNCGAGISLTTLALVLSKKHLSGLEWAIGIPRATVGGAIRGNAEAFGVSMGNLVKQVEILDLKKLVFETFDQKECKFEYRDSVFKHMNNYIIWSAVLEFMERSDEEIDILTKKSIEHRKNSYPKSPNAGSIFKNAITFEQLKNNNEKIAQYALDKGIVSRLGNVGTGFLIDYLGLKGKKIGGAQISNEHGNFIINTGNATANDVLMLISFVKTKIRDEIGIQLHEEIKLVGF